MRKEKRAATEIMTGNFPVRNQIFLSQSGHWENMQWKLGGCAAVLCCLALVACAPVGPDYQPPKTHMPGQWQELSTETFSPGTGQTELWWMLLGDPLLDKLVARAANFNNDLKIAEANIREARAQRIIAAATGSLAGSAAAARSRRSDNTSSSGGSQDLFLVGFDAGWELDIFGGVRRATEAADAGLAASREDFRDVLVSLQGEVVGNYIELRGGQMRLATTWNNIASQQKTVDLVKGRFEVGLGNELDLVQAQTQLSLLKALVPALEKSIRQLMHQLALLLGQSPEALVAELSPQADIPPIPPLLQIDLPSELLRQRPDIRSAERRIAAATAEIGVATAELFPRFSLTGLLGLQSSSLSDLVASGSRYWSYGPVINLNIFDQGAARAGIEISKARRDSALAVYEQTVLTALAEVEDALVAFAKEKKTSEILREAVASGKKAVRISNGLYETGLADFLNVLQSERTLYQSEDQLVQSNQRLALAMVSIFKALGGGRQEQISDNKTPVTDLGSAPVVSKSSSFQ
jgi:NodT family efflux transporter outer membrane factor (OMF) lipoprotein